ncbi:hypothetical protein AVEN_159833-1, partial [Araneus ventricosus]
MRTLFQLTQNLEKSFPDTAKVDRENFYVDDLLTSADSVPEARRLVKDFIQSIIRVGVRLSHGQSLTFYQKHPMRLPSRHIVTMLFIRSFDERHFHAGPLLVVSLLRQKYWFVACFG